MIYGPLDGEMARYEYDCRNRLVKAGNTRYEYDAENNRIAVETADYREEYVINSNAELSQVLTATRYEKNATGDLRGGETTTYIYGNGLVSQYTEEVGIEYYHYNNIGSTMYLTKNGVKTHEFAYSTYGELTLGGYGEVRFLYNGQLGVMTDENSLYYMRARYYNSEIRRFINQDIVTGSIENSQSLNRYAYCQGNLVNYFDPFGLEPCEFFTGLGHGMLNFMGLIPGIGDVFDIINAIWYLSEGKVGRAIESGIASLPFIGNFLPDRRTCDYVRRVLNIASYGGTAVLAGQGMVDGGQALWADISSGQCSGWSIFLGVANIGLNGATLFFSGKSFASETKDLNKMLKADGVYDKVGNWIQDSTGVLNEDVFTRFMPDGNQLTDFTHLPGNSGIEIPRRLSVKEMTYLTQEYGVEFAQVYQRGAGVNGGGGKYYIYSGDISSVKVPINKDIILINHTHPAGTAFPSGADKELLSLLAKVGSPQKISEIIPIGKPVTIKFGADGIK